MAYGKVHEKFWDDPKIRALSERGRVFMLYLMTCRHKNRLGCYVLDAHYAAADLQWEAKAVSAAIAELVKARRIEYDAEHRVVFVSRFLKHNALENHNVVRGAITELSSLPETPLIHSLLAAVESYRKGHYHPLIEALRNRCANDSPNHLPNKPAHVSLGLGLYPDHNLTPPVGPPLPNGSAGADAPDPEKKASPGRKTQLPDSWVPTATHRRLAVELHVDVDAEVVKFRDHAKANGRVQKDWNASFNTWLRRAPEFRRGPAPGSEAARVRTEYPGRDRQHAPSTNGPESLNGYVWDDRLGRMVKRA